MRSAGFGFVLAKNYKTIHNKNKKKKIIGLSPT